MLACLTQALDLGDVTLGPRFPRGPPIGYPWVRLGVSSATPPEPAVAPKFLAAASSANTTLSGWVPALSPIHPPGRADGCSCHIGRLSPLGARCRGRRRLIGGCHARVILSCPAHGPGPAREMISCPGAGSRGGELGKVFLPGASLQPGSLVDRLEEAPIHPLEWSSAASSAGAAPTGCAPKARKCRRCASARRLTEHQSKAPCAPSASGL
mmetsp:Transcript_30545/g.67052  ORF Transcript_30545/g.67052 Transcript_30545/m.67052 type:complete len:211 (-) Transcript_30545:808-1440(-)